MTTYKRVFKVGESTLKNSGSSLLFLFFLFFSWDIWLDQNTKGQKSMQKTMEISILSDGVSITRIDSIN